LLSIPGPVSYDAAERAGQINAAHRCTIVTGVTDERPFFDPSVPAYAYKQVADHVAARIENGELPPATRLPGERDLAEQYGVALGTARRAVRELRDRGLVLTLPAKGTYIKAGTGEAR
jgi:GntR family transcriptional regulator